MHMTIAIISIALLITPFLFLLYKPPEGPNRFGEAARNVNFIDAIKRFFSNYFNFTGRASRSEFWYAMLFYAAVSFLIGFIDAPDIVFSIWSLITIIPFLSVSARRLHDTNRSGWLQIVSWFAPAGTIIAIVWFCKPPGD
ncbi:DUF805 domain-containing protein [Manganibacter manganicus]|uniref:DUF805 domain-containing protein n=1 Tax=Manganibacter manganicus TaxID=1873176 RepID=A0A1V8RSB9_9HYPH|nr:DUF805 domain-containing protein [Pseudaminobacter manganicus]OQM75899.1 hypothetical protein BFN67_03065 [Pseudaminobacter manganicus]